MSMLFRTVGVVSVIIAVAGGPAGASGPGRNVVERPYRTPVPGAAYGSDYKAYYYDCTNAIGCAIIPTSGRRFAAIEIQDTTDQKVFFAVYTMPGSNHLGDYCGSTGHPIATQGARELLVHVVAGVCPDESTPSVPTTGLVRATFSRKS